MTRTAAILDDLTVEQLTRDPYPVYAALRRDCPVAWIEPLNMWWVTRYEDTRAVLVNDADFVTGTPASLIFDTFGEQMLAVDGKRHARLRPGRLNGKFMPQAIRAGAGPLINLRVRSLIDTFAGDGVVELRHAFAARLPILVMLDLFGLEDTAEPRFRTWYDAFEAGLANYQGDPGVRARARMAMSDFHSFFLGKLDAARVGRGRPGLLSDYLAWPEDDRLSDAEITRNAAIIFFGGISTVEAVVLNMMWTLLTHGGDLERVRADRNLLDAAFDETVRWVAPVQSATRHAARICEISGVRIPAGATVNCILASANHDETIFETPDRFHLDRENASRHLGFAIGPHFCLGRHLARAQARAAVDALLDLGDRLRLDNPDQSPTGYEFRQPSALNLRWDKR